LAIGSLLLAGGGVLDGRGARARDRRLLEIPILFEVTIRGVAIILRELVVVDLGEISRLCFSKRAKKY
jgi:hypothetical protein